MNILFLGHHIIKTVQKLWGGGVHIANWDEWKEVIWIKFFAGKVIDVVKELLFQMNDWGSIGSALGSMIIFLPSVMVFKEQEGENTLHERILELCLQGREGWS